ncbi:pilus assembly protein [Marinagarivorans cellulosilyticus]|uniref:Type IV pilus assembly protein PilY1 n=1 Tax=Marinagarivorans cellulosilyticus TaxID=2721545 RepID=A0AAN1WE26_9GAMM|nr:PilC/PilY family type IV pilus protein [Marinagarivorans cellulosilyticus]BCD95887.1 type IV pilus assembly protein PilY1 [Marinagarivorans cellulosilyticus]
MEKYSTGIAAAVTYMMTSILLSMSTMAQNAIDYQSIPPFTSSNNTPPMVMLSMSSDHQLFFKAYNDFYDIDGDGIADLTYSKNIKYMGYFESQTCYKYSNNVFEPDTPATDDYYCNQGASDQWSGNFLNWVSMTRIDVVRKILYGGFRSVDSSTSTVLERSHLPNDAHSFAKYYNGTDLGKLTPFGSLKVGKNAVDSGITFCNTTVDTTIGVRSHESKADPLIRAAKGNHSFWPAGERWQCLYRDELPDSGVPSINSDRGALQSIGIYASHDAPSTFNEKMSDYVARVKVCTGKSNLGREGCMAYPDGNSKPIGILQKYGQNGEILFGLMTGSYKKNKSGGVLRKNIGSIGDEINVSTNGSIKKMSTSGGIIRALNSLRLANWFYQPSEDESTERVGTYDYDGCPWGLTYYNDGRCTNWGNPFAEILLETYRYFSGQEPTPSYVADDSFVSPDLGVIKWQKAVKEDNHCSNLNVLAFNSSTISYDGDNVDPSDIGASFVDLNRLTSELGRQEGISGGNYFVGKTYGFFNDELCTAKRVTSLASVRGTCPDAPRLNGSYYSSGLAYYAKNNDINSEVDGEQTVNTFGFSLAPSIPKIEIPQINNKNKKITIFPACRNNNLNGNCAIVDFKVIEAHNDDDKDGTFTGLMYVTWEDSEQGGDFDQDLNGIIAYELTQTRLVVKSRVLKKSTDAKMGFGFIIDGVGSSVKLNGADQFSGTGNGYHVLTGINGFSGGDCNNCTIDFRWNSKEFTLDQGKASFLEQPLFYAAKYGGFTDKNDNGIPDLQDEWDTKDNYTGAPTPDGIPDNYHNVNNPQYLELQFDRALAEILDSAASGTGSSVVTNASDGVGLYLQSLFYPSLSYKGNDLSWVSTLNGMFMDQYNRVREDSDQNGRLTLADNIIDVEFEPETKTMMAQRYIANEDGSRGGKKGSLIALHDLKPVWSAHKQLANITDPTKQRTYVQAATTQRHILTAIDNDADGLITSNAAVVPFTADNFSGDNYYLVGKNSDHAEQVVNYIRGEDRLGFRSRKADLLDNVDGDEKWLLGDIANASPVIVGPPKVGYDVEFSDTTYRAYRKHYRNRRTMVYAAANDGMLHAFNAGYFNNDEISYATDKHPLGSELWAYVPYNLLPHLRWLTEYNYPHVAYIDGKVQTFDVNIFADDNDHPGGWGTILVAGMRFGGGLITTEDKNGNKRVMRSAYVVLDVTNPESPPRLIAEITNPALGYTTGNVDVVKVRSPNAQTGQYDGGVNNWYLTFGSGPKGADQAASYTAQKNAVSDQTAKVFLYDFKAGTLMTIDTGVADSFVGGVTVTDWNRDFTDDAIYYGLVSGRMDAPDGQLRRLNLSPLGSKITASDSVMLSGTGQAFSAAPYTRIDSDYNYWVFAGTGRFFHDADGTYADQNSFYGLKEKVGANGNITGDAIDAKKLIDVSNIQTYSNGQVLTYDGKQVFLQGSEAVETNDDVTGVVADTSGWRLDFSNGSARNIGQASQYSTSLLFTVFTPSDDICSGDVGSTRLYQREFFNGLSPAHSAITEKDKTVGDDDDMGEAIPEAIELGDNYYEQPDEEGLTQSNEGELQEIDLGDQQLKDRRESWRELNKDW